MLRFIIFLWILLCNSAVLVAQTLPRTALIIGNSDYKETPLTNPLNDAVDMTSSLRELSFEVMSYTNIDRQTMREAIREFGEKLLKKGGVGLFYYAGHGVQIKGQNYLIPINADIKSVDEVEDESIDIASVLRKMETANNGFNIIILDACRNNPFARSFRSIEQGLAKMEGPIGSIIAYATAPGSTASDGKGRNGLYTSHLLQAIKTPGLSIEDVFKQVRIGLRKDTQGQQTPWESSSLTGHFVFSKASSENTAPSAAPSLATAASPISPPPPIPSATGLVQVIANIAGGTIFANGMKQGEITENHTLNLQRLSGKEVEIRIEQLGYQSQTQWIELQPGVWQQAYFNLIPEVNSNTTSTRQEATPPTTQHASETSTVKSSSSTSQSISATSEKQSTQVIEFDFNNLVRTSP